MTLTTDDLLKLSPAALPAGGAELQQRIYDTARAKEEARKDVVQAQQELPKSELLDAEAHEQALHDGKKPPAKRQHTEAHERRVADAKHLERVSELAHTRALRDAKAWLGERDSELTRLIEQNRAKAQAAWHAQVEKLIPLYGAYRRADADAKVAGLTRRTVASVKIATRQVQNIEVARESPKHGFVETPDVIALLSDLGMSPTEPEPAEPEPTETPPDAQFEAEAADRRREAAAQRELEELPPLAIALEASAQEVKRDLDQERIDACAARDAQIKSELGLQ